MRSLLLASLILVAACDPTVDTADPFSGFDEYLIEEGDHNSTTAVAFASGSEEVIQAGFDSSAVYETVDPANQGDINKLWGFSDCSDHHHTSSARFGWRWYDDELQIHAYTYVDSVRISQLMGTADLGEVIDLSIELDEDTYIFTMGSDSAVMDRGCDGSGGIRYMLYPYFGGDETAPHDVTVYVSEF